MKKWAFVVMAEAEEGFVYVNGVGVYEICGFLDSENKPNGDSDQYRKVMQVRTESAGAYAPEYPPGYEPHWVEFPEYIGCWRYFVNGYFVSEAALSRYKRIGRFDIPSHPRIQTFRVFSFFGMDNYRIGDVKLDIDNDTTDDLKGMVVSHYTGRFNLGITAGAGDEDGPVRCYRSIADLAYTTILSSSNISTSLVNKTGDWNHFKNLLWAAVTTSHTVAKVPQNQKVPLTGNKLMLEYNLDPSFPIVAMWALESGPQWSPDWKQEAFDQFMDLVGDALS